MRLAHGLHLAYCTNVHRGETWEQTFHSLNTDTLEVRARVAAGRPYGIGLRLSERAARELAQPPNLAAFKQWLNRNDCYVFTINGFPYGQFHGTRVKENVFRPDWSTTERLAYTNLLFDLLAELLPPGMEGSVSTLPGSFKEFALDAAAQAAMRRNFWLCLAHVGDLYERTGKIMHLGVEPEPLGLFETSAETVLFVQQLRADHGFDVRLDRHFGVNYDACHLAVEFEEPADALKHFQQNNIRISKLHITSALRLRPRPETLEALAAFADDIYLHQVVEQGPDRTLRRYRDLPDALAAARAHPPAAGTEWRVHFHIPLHTQPTAEFENTSDHVTGLFDALKLNPQLCRHLEMETYTWEVLPPQFKDLKLVDQLAAEYRWTLEQLRQRGMS